MCRLHLKNTVVVEIVVVAVLLLLLLPLLLPVVVVVVAVAVVVVVPQMHKIRKLYVTRYMKLSYFRQTYVASISHIRSFFIP